MISQQVLQAQLQSLNMRFRVFGRKECRELKKILQPGEKVIQCAYGFYQGGSGLLVATADRLLLIDKRRFFLNLEDLRYDAIDTVELSLSYVRADLFLKSGARKLLFKSMSDARLKKIKDYTTKRIQENALEKRFEPVSRNIKAAFIDLDVGAKPYLNPAWRARHTTLLPRTRPSKFYPAQPSN